MPQKRHPYAPEMPGALGLAGRQIGLMVDITAALLGAAEELRAR